MGTTAAHAGYCTVCVSGVGGSCTSCVFVVGMPVFFVRALINITAPMLPYTVACKPAAVMVKPGFTGASPLYGVPPINNAPIALAPSLFVFGGWDSFVSDASGLNPPMRPLPMAALFCVTFLHL